jgi:hypothetical protein
VSILQKEFDTIWSGKKREQVTLSKNETYSICMHVPYMKTFKDLAETEENF